MKMKVKQMVKMNNDFGSVMMIFTGESPAQIIKSGVVTTPLPFTLSRAEDCKYVVCCQDATVDGATEPHNAAFLIGIVTGSNAAERNGKLMGVSLNISHYVLITKRDAWYAKRNVSHFFFPSLAKARIRLGRYDFTPIVKQSTVPMRAAPAYAMAAKSRKGLVKRGKLEAVQPIPDASSEPVKTFHGSDLRNLISNALNVDSSKVSGTIKVRDNSVTITIEF